MRVCTTIVKGGIGLFLACVLATQVGCARKKTYGAIEVVTDPPGAEVIDLKDDTHKGRTPVKVVWEGEQGRPEYVTLQMRKKGYREEITSVWVNTRHKSREAAMTNPQPVTVELRERKK
ncbi:MAG: hypothetical protein CSA34_00075 [Desulfobulbus propionicus]|nr:MAG: hypothetical protein CSA34_00075 [Desulfobulbus propionicus]